MRDRHGQVKEIQNARCADLHLAQKMTPSRATEMLPLQAASKMHFALSQRINFENTLFCDTLREYGVSQIAQR